MTGVRSGCEPRLVPYGDAAGTRRPSKACPRKAFDHGWEQSWEGW